MVKKIIMVGGPNLPAVHAGLSRLADTLIGVEDMSNVKHFLEERTDLPRALDSIDIQWEDIPFIGALEDVDVEDLEVTRMYYKDWCQLSQMIQGKYTKPKFLRPSLERLLHVSFATYKLYRSDILVNVQRLDNGLYAISLIFKWYGIWEVDMIYLTDFSEYIGAIPSRHTVTHDTVLSLLTGIGREDIAKCAKAMLNKWPAVPFSFTEVEVWKDLKKAYVDTGILIDSMSTNTFDDKRVSELMNDFEIDAKKEYPVVEAVAKGSFSIRSADTLVEWKYHMYDKVNNVTIVVQSREGVAELLGVPLSEVPEGRLWKCTIGNWQIWQLKPEESVWHQ